MGNGNNNLTIRSTETGEERFLSTRLRKIWDIHWAPDSRTIVAGGVTKDDVVQVSFRYGLFTGGFGLHYGAERLRGAACGAGGGGRSESDPISSGEIPSPSNFFR